MSGKKQHQGSITIGAHITRDILVMALEWLAYCAQSSARWASDRRYRGQEYYNLNDTGEMLRREAQRLREGNQSQVAPYYPKYRERERAAQESRSIAREPGNYDAGPYQHGFANGIEHVLAIFQDREPYFLDAPEQYAETELEAELTDDDVEDMDDAIAQQESTESTPAPGAEAFTQDHPRPPGYVAGNGMREEHLAMFMPLVGSVVRIESHPLPHVYTGFGILTNIEGYGVTIQIGTRYMPSFSFSWNEIARIVQLAEVLDTSVELRDGVPVIDAKFCYMRAGQKVTIHSKGFTESVDAEIDMFGPNDDSAYLRYRRPATRKFTLWNRLPLAEVDAIVRRDDDGAPAPQS